MTLYNTKVSISHIFTHVSRRKEHVVHVRKLSPPSDALRSGLVTDYDREIVGDQLSCAAEGMPM